MIQVVCVAGCPEGDMEVHQRLSVIFCLAVGLGACSEKSSNTVFPESVNRPMACSGAMIEDQFIVQWENGRVTLERSPNAKHFKAEFLEPQLERIKHVEFNKRIKLLPAVQFSETTTSAQTGNLVEWGQTAIDASYAWNANLRGQGVKVGVVDTAIDIEHSQMKKQMSVNLAELNGLPGVDDDGNGLIDDIYGWDFLYDTPHGATPIGDSHGTHVAGIVAADHSEGPIKGIAPDAKVVAASFLSESGDGDLYGALMALDYVAAQGAKVINASWGGPHCSKSLQTTLQNLSDQDILIVVAAGNSGLNLDYYPDYPAAFETPTQLTVGALKPSGYLAGFSNTSYRFVHLAAPGDSIYSTIPGDQFGSMNGTSMAAPFVAGAAAVLRSHRPSATALQVRQAILESVDKGNYRVQSQGTLNLRKALLKLESLVP